MIINIRKLKKATRELDARFYSPNGGPWQTPEVALLPEPSEDVSQKELDYRVPVDPVRIENVLIRYGVKAEFRDYKIGSAVTTFEFEIPVGTRFNSLIHYRDDIARDLGTPSLRIIKTISDSSLIGLEVQNLDRYPVAFKGLYNDIPEGLVLPLILGEDTYGKPVYEDLVNLPHMLVAGQTGSGKSVFLNTCVATLLCRKTPEELQLAIIDPKRVEFTAYKGIPHLLKVEGQEGLVTDVEDARWLLNKIVDIMEERFRLLEGVQAKKISDYNKNAGTKLPYIVFIVDEFADLMMMGNRAQSKDVENKIVRIAQKARAVGIHMILATQKPLATVMTSLIKANMPARIAFSVTSGGDSRVILDEMGAESLTGNGDMLYRNPNARCEYVRLRRIQSPWISDEDIRILLHQSE